MVIPHAPSKSIRLRFLGFFAFLSTRIITVPPFFSPAPTSGGRAARLFPDHAAFSAHEALDRPDDRRREQGHEHRVQGKGADRLAQVYPRVAVL